MPTPNYKHIIEANKDYSAHFGNKTKLSIPPVRRIAVLTCMDARLDVHQLAGLHEGDAHIIRNAGGRASDDAIRSLIISYKLLGTNEFYVVHHTNCGMQLFTNETMANLLASSLETAQLGPDGFVDVGKGPGSTEGRYINFLTVSDPEDAVREDVLRIANHPLVPKSISIFGLIYDVHTGLLNPIDGAVRVGSEV